MSELTQDMREKLASELRHAISRNEDLLRVKQTTLWKNCRVSIVLNDGGYPLVFPIPPATIRAMLPKMLANNKALIAKLGKQLGLCGKA